MLHAPRRNRTATPSLFVAFRRAPARPAHRNRTTAFVLAATTIVLSGCTGVLFGCTGNSVYEVRGRVAGFGQDDRTIIIEHEDIPNLMPAMTMPFEIADSATADRFTVGDAVAFELVVRRGRAEIYNLSKLPDDALPRHPAATESTFAASDPGILQPGDVVPDAQLTTHAGTPLQLSDLRGHRVVLTFIYTQCPLSDYCLLMSANFARLQPQLAGTPGVPAHLLSVSFDPANDTPETLRRYAEQYTDDLSNWTFATGDSAAVRHLAERFGVFYQVESDQIVHNLATMLIDEEGVVRHVWRGNEWTPEDVLAALVDAWP